LNLYKKKLAAEKAAKKIDGVKAIAEDIQIGISPAYNKTDTEIAEAVLDALQWHSSVQEDTIKIGVENGIVRLEGEVEWAYQRSNMVNAIESLTRVRSIVNLITIKPRIIPFDIEQKIAAAFKRSAIIDADRISVEVNGQNIKLIGRVRSYVEKKMPRRRHGRHRV
jgi:osmotically-inducible protein OsmY